MDSSQEAFSLLRQNPSPVATPSQGRPNQTTTIHAYLTLPSSASSLLTSIHHSLPHNSLSLPPSSILPFTTSLHPSFVHKPSSPTSLPFPSTLPTNDLTDLRSMLLWTLHEPGTIALTVMYCLSFLLGFVGNLMSLRVLTNRRGRQLAGISATRSLLINLAVCDLAVVCVCMPITLGSQIYMAWVYGDLLCRAVPFTQAVSVSASVLTLTVISINRYFNVRSPLRARSMFTRRRILVTVAVVWLVSSVMCVPIAVMNRRREFSFGTFAILICLEEWSQPRLKQGYNVLLFVALYCLPVTFNLTIGFLTGRRLWGGNKSAFSDLDPRSEALHVTRLKMRQKIAKMVVCLVLLFAVSWLPLYLADLWIDREHKPPSWLLQARPFAQWLGLTNSSLNPICYCFIGDLYRSAKVIRTRYCQKVASLFSSSSFSNSVAVTTGSTILDSGLIAAKHHHIAVPTVTASASTVTLPRLFGLARGQARLFRLGHGLEDNTESVGGSDHSISDWCRSSPSVCDSSLLPQYSANSTELLPIRRHSIQEEPQSLPPRMESVNIDMLPPWRHSGGLLYDLSGDQRDVLNMGKDSLSGPGRNNKSHIFSVIVDSEEETTDMTSL